MNKWIKKHAEEIGVVALPSLTLLLTLLLSDELLGELFEANNPHKLVVKVLVVLSILVLIALQFGMAVKRRKKTNVEANLRRDIGKLQKTAEQRSNELRTLRQELDAAYGDFELLARGYLVGIARLKLGFGNKNPCFERISLYSHDAGDNFFVLMSRFASNPTLDGKSRTIYKDTEGCIAKAWQHGHCFENTLPDHAADADAYLAAAEKQGMPRDVTAKIRMKSRLLYAVSIQNATKDAPIAVLVVESTHPDRYDEKTLREAIGAPEMEFLSTLVTRSTARMPQPSMARREGF